MMENQENKNIQNALERLVAIIPGTKAAIITTVDGFEKARVAISTQEASRLAALASSISAIGKMAVQEAISSERYKCITIESNDGFIFIAELSGDLVLLMIASKETVLAKLLYHTRNFSI